MVKVLINEVEMKFKKDNKTPYARVKADGEWYSCFDSKVIETVQTLKGQYAEAEITQKGDFKNIVDIALYSETSTQPAEEPVKNSPYNVEVNNGNISVEKKTTTMYTSYAKDLFIALLETIKDRKEGLPYLPNIETMTLATNLIKQARDEFK